MFHNFSIKLKFHLEIFITFSKLFYLFNDFLNALFVTFNDYLVDEPLTLILTSVSCLKIFNRFFNSPHLPFCSILNIRLYPSVRILRGRSDFVSMSRPLYLKVDSKLGLLIALLELLLYQTILLGIIIHKVILLICPLTIVFIFRSNFVLPL